LPSYSFAHPNAVFTTTLTLTATGAGTASYSVKFSRNTTASWASYNLYNTANFSFTLNGGFQMAANYTYDFRTGGTERTVGSGTISGLPLATNMAIGGFNNPDNSSIGQATASGSFVTAGTPTPTTPTWSTGTALTAATRGTAYSRTVVASPVTGYSIVTQSGGTGTYSINNSGVITGTPSAIGTASVTVRATNSGSTADRTFTFTVNPAVPVFTDTTFATAIRGEVYNTGNEVVATETQNTGYSSTVSIPGLTFNSNGTLTGTPTTLGTYNFTVTATNITGSTNANVSLIVGRPIPVYTDSTVSSPATWGVSYTDAVEATDATNYAVVAGGDFPPGLTLNAGTGAITSGPSGPTALGSFTFQIRASNETGGVNTPSRTINVISPVRVASVTGPTGSFVTGAVNVNTATGPTGSFVPGVVRIWNGTTWAPARLT
jgi:large repetitive protein